MQGSGRTLSSDAGPRILHTKIYIDIRDRTSLNQKGDLAIPKPYMGVSEKGDPNVVT